MNEKLLWIAIIENQEFPLFFTSEEEFKRWANLNDKQEKKGQPFVRIVNSINLSALVKSRLITPKLIEKGEKIDKLEEEKRIKELDIERINKELEELKKSPVEEKNYKNELLNFESNS